MYSREEHGEQVWPAPYPIAALQGASGEVIQELLRRFVERRATSFRVAGVIEKRDQAMSRKAWLHSIADGQTFPLFQDLGAGSIGCCLDSTGPVQAGEVVSRHIAAGCDVVVLNKFGKLEAESHSGLLAAFVSAVEHDVPVLTAVAPKYADAWARFASPFFTFLTPDDTALDEWWRSLCRSRARSGLHQP